MGVMKRKREIKALASDGRSAAASERTWKRKGRCSAAVKALVELRNAASAYRPAGNQREAQRRFNEPTKSAGKKRFAMVKGWPGESKAWAKVGLVGITENLGATSM